MGLAWQAPQLYRARSAQIRRSPASAPPKHGPASGPAGISPRARVPSTANARAVMSNETAGGIKSIQQTRHGALLGLSTRALETDALFVSGLQRYEDPSASQVRRAVATAIRAFGCSGCAGRVAQEFGDHPETAVIRMRWARSVAREAFAASAPEYGAGAGAWQVVRPRRPAEQASGSPMEADGNRCGARRLM